MNETLRSCLTINSSLYDDEKKRRLHLDAIKMLAMNMGISSEEVERLYNIVLGRFKRGAKVKDFLPILVSKRVEYLLRVRSNNGKNQSPSKVE